MFVRNFIAIYICIMKRQFKQWWSTVPPISTKWTITSHLNLGNNKRTTAYVWIFVCFLFYHTITKQSTTLNNQWLKRKSDAGMKKQLRFIFSFRMWIFYKQGQSLQLYNYFYQRLTAFNKTSGCLSRVFVLCFNLISNHQFSKIFICKFSKYDPTLKLVK